MDRHPGVWPRDPVNASYKLPSHIRSEQDTVVLADMDSGIPWHGVAVEERAIHGVGSIVLRATPEEANHCDSVLLVNSRPFAELNCSTDGRHVPVPSSRVCGNGATDGECQQKKNDRPMNHA